MLAGKFVDYVELFKNAAREKRLTVRDFSFEASKAGGLEGQVEQAKWEVQQVLTTIIRWCKAHYGEVYSGWMHLKCIRTFVESVLRYGLPVDFLAVLVEPNMKKEKQCQAQLTSAIEKMRSELVAHKHDDEELDNDDPDNLTYVCHKFMIGGR